MACCKPTTAERIGKFMDVKSDHITKTFARMDMQKLIRFFIYGEESKTQNGESYDERLEKASEPIYQRIYKLYPNATDATEPCNELSNALSAFQDVYMEIGMKAGARLLYQLMIEDDKQPAKPAK